MRLRNRLIDSSGSLPARSLARTDAKNHTRTRAPAVIKASVSQRLLSAARMPVTSRMRPTADRIAPPVSKDRVGSGGRGSWTRRLSTTMTAMISAWKTNAARQLIAEVMRPPSSAVPTPSRIELPMKGRPGRERPRSAGRRCHR